MGEPIAESRVVGEPTVAWKTVLLHFSPQNVRVHFGITGVGEPIAESRVVGEPIVACRYVAVSATTAVYDGLEILCALAPNTG